MTGAVHRAALAAAAAAYCGLALPFLSDHSDNDRCNYADKRGTDDYRPDITCDPLKHMLNFL